MGVKKETIEAGDYRLLLGDDDDRYDHNMQYLLGEHCFGVSE
jgi:hypothetical protein